MDAGVWWIVGILLFTGFVWWVTWESPAPSREADSGTSPFASFRLPPSRIVVGIVAWGLLLMDVALVVSLVILPNFVFRMQENMAGFVPLLAVSFVLALHFVFTFWAQYMDPYLFRTGIGLFLFPCATISAAFVFSLALFTKIIDRTIFWCPPDSFDINRCGRGVPHQFFATFAVMGVITACAMVSIIGHVVFYPEKEKEPTGYWRPPREGKAKRTE